MNNLFKQQLSLFLLLVVITFSSCTDEGNLLTVANVKVLDSIGNPVSNIRMTLVQGDDLITELGEVSGYGGASFVTDIFGRSRIKYYSQEGVQTTLHIQAEVFTEDKRNIFCTSSERIFENREQDFVFYINPPTIPVSIDISNALQDSAILGGKDFVMSVVRRSGGCFLGLASISSTEINSNGNIDILVYPNADYIMTLFNRTIDLQHVVNFSVDSTAQTVVF